MAAIKQELVFDEEKILIPYRSVGYEYLFIVIKSHFKKYIDEDIAREPCIIKQLNIFAYPVNKVPVQRGGNSR